MRTTIKGAQAKALTCASTRHRALLVEVNGDAEVRDHQTPVSGEQDVLGLDVCGRSKRHQRLNGVPHAS